MDEDKSQPDKPSLPSDEDVAARFQRIRDELKDVHLGVLPEDEKLKDLAVAPTVKKVDSADFDARLADIESKARSAKGQYATATNRQSPKQIDDSSKASRSLAKGMTIAYTILGFPVVGFGLGFLADYELKSVLGKGIGMLLGVMLGLWLAIKLINEDAKRGD